MSVTHVAANTNYYTITNLDRLNGLKKMSFSTWAYFPVFPVAVGSFFSKSNAGAAPFVFEIDVSSTGEIIWVFDNAGTGQASLGAGAVATGAFYHICAVFDGGGATNAEKWQGYVNAVAKTITFTANAPGTALGTAAGQAAFSGVRAGGTFWLDGSIFNMKLWDVALSPSEVAMDMQSLHPVRPDRCFYWNECRGAATVVSPHSTIDNVITISTLSGDGADPAGSGGDPSSLSEKFTSPLKLIPRPSRRVDRGFRSFGRTNLGGIGAARGFQRGM